MEVEGINYPQPISCVKPLDYSLLPLDFNPIRGNDDQDYFANFGGMYSSDMVQKFWPIFVIKVWMNKSFRTYLYRLVLCEMVYNLWGNKNELKYGCRPKTNEQISQYFFWRFVLECWELTWEDEDLEKKKKKKTWEY